MLTVTHSARNTAGFGFHAWPHLPRERGNDTALIFSHIGGN